jgi:predicted metal-dependent phosphoesterase TrpH
MDLLRVDLHIHSCLSPCGDYGMSPANVVAVARERGLDAIGLCDHNSAENVPAFREAGRKAGLIVIGGMEVATREEVHVLAFFDEPEGLMALQEVVYGALDGVNDEEAFGPQIVVDESSEPLGLNERLLIGATRLSLGETVDTIHEFGGLAIAAHVDRSTFGVIEQMGFIPPDVSFDALEVSWRSSSPGQYAVNGLPVVTFSDAHYLHEIGRVVTAIEANEASARELALALTGRRGRRLVA